MMSDRTMSRRQALAAGLSGVVAAGLSQANGAEGAAKAGGRAPAPFRFCLNTGTIRGKKLPFDQEVEVAAKAGYEAIEPWIDNIASFVKGGGSLKDLKKKIADLGLTVEDGIGFPSWIVDDDARRAQGLEQMKRDMATLAEIGGKRIAAPPAGANNTPGLDLKKAAERYRAVLDLGDQMGVVPQLEMWGASKNLSRLSEGAFVAIESGHPKACLLADVFHIYRSGADFNGLRLMSNRMIQVFHMNDYPADPPREKARDSDRVFPGDGVAPLSQIVRDLADNGGGQVLSLELFNPTYWQKDALEVARTGLEKMKAAVAKALG
jgi:sugar phosphate isomerase/epimerase